MRKKITAGLTDGARITAYAHYVKATRADDRVFVNASCRFSKQLDGEWVRREEIQEYQLRGGEDG